MENFLLQFYGGRADDDGATAVPREILVPVLPTEEAATEAELTEWLSELRGSRVSLRVPQRGDKRALAETVTRNAAEALTQHRLKRASDLTARSAALTELADTLGMDVAPLRIECIDISHVQGTDVVASLVVFEDGLPKRSDYRRFAIRDRPGDDVASIAEVVRRRFTHGADRRRHAAEDRGRCRRGDADVRRPATGDAGVGYRSTRLGPSPTTSRPTGRGHRPGHRPAAAVRLPAAVAGGRRRRPAGQCRRRPSSPSSGIVDVTICGLAKRLEEVWVPGAGRADHLPADQRGAVPAAAAAGRGAPVRDHLPPGQAVEVDDGVRAGQRAGLGEVRRKALVRHFGSVAALRRAGVEDILAGSRDRPPDGGGGGRGAGRAADGDRRPPAPHRDRPTHGRRRIDPTRTSRPVPIPSSGTQEPAVPVNGFGDGVPGGA